jgi:transposase
MGKRSEVPVTERCEAVLSFLRREEPGAVIARRYSVAEATLYRWLDDFLAVGEAVLAGGTRNGTSAHDRQVAEQERQIESRDQVIGELTIANRVLKNSRRDPADDGRALRDRAGDRGVRDLTDAPARSGAGAFGNRHE